MARTIAEVPATEPTAEPNQAKAAGGALRPLRVLFATDGSETASAAARLLAHLPLPAGSAVQAVVVLDAQAWQVPESLKGAEREWGGRIVEEAETGLAREGVQLTHAIRRGAPAFEILEAADSFNADLVVVGSRGRTGLERFLLGSVAENVTKHAHCPVLVARAWTQGLRRVVLAVDGSEHSNRATRFAARFPLAPDAEVTVCYVVQPYYYPVTGYEYAPGMDQVIAEVQKQQQGVGERLVVAAAKCLEPTGTRVRKVVSTGDPAAVILEIAREQEADLIIAGARGISAIQALLVGSVADRLLRHAHCSVLIVP